MDEIKPFYTLDGSVGLYNTVEHDIYHSVLGAFSEANNKFILPANFDKFFENNDKIKILDLCFGIGYNTKSFLNYFFKKKSALTENNDTIYTNNIKSNKSIVQIYSNNILNKILKIFNYKNLKNENPDEKNFKFKIKIDAVDKNETLIKLSPLFRFNSDIKRIKRDISGLKSDIPEIYSYMKKFESEFSVTKNEFIFHDEVNIVILKTLLDQYKDEYINNDLNKAFKDKKLMKMLRRDFRGFIKFYLYDLCKTSHGLVKYPFLHNIYYRYISTCYKNTLKVLENSDISIKYISDDARNFLQANECEYDFIFLDAFSPSKCPALWSQEFFSLLYKHLSESGVILTYSNSAAVRNAMLKNNFYIGKIYNRQEKRFTGTVASKNKKIIDYPLDDFELGLLNTNAGIVYRDNGLKSSNDQILSQRKIDLAESKLQSSTQYIKENKGEYNEI